MHEIRQGYQPIAYRGKVLAPPCCEDGTCPKCVSRATPDSAQLAMPEIPPPPPPPEAYLLAQVREAYLILQRLNVSFESKLPNNVYMALAHLHIEIIARTTSPVAAVRKEAACEPGN